MNSLNMIKNILRKHIRKIIFNQLVDEWLESKKVSTKESTYYHYVYVVNKYLMPTFGNMTIKQLKRYNYNEFTSELKDELSTKTIRDILCILKSILYYTDEEYNCGLKVKK